MSIKPLLAFSFFYLSLRGNDFKINRCSLYALDKWIPGYYSPSKGPNTIEKEGVVLRENPDHFFIEPSYRIEWPHNAKQIYTDSADFWSLFATCLGAKSAVPKEIISDQKHFSYNDLQEFAQYVPGSASFFDVTVIYPSMSSEKKFVAILFLTDKDKPETDFFVFDPSDAPRLLSFHLPYRAAFPLQKCIVGTNKNLEKNRVSFIDNSANGLLTWKKGSFLITIMFSETEFNGEKWPSVHARVQSDYGNGIIQPNERFGYFFCKLYQILEKYMGETFKKYHPNKKNFSCMFILVGDLSNRNRDLVTYIFNGKEILI